MIELLTTVAVASIGLAIAVPSFRSLYLDQVQTSVINAFTTSLNYARSEAVTRRTPVTMCVAGDSERCAMRPGWEAGWIVFVDEDGDGLRDEAETVLRRHETLPASLSLQGNLRLASRITFSAEGMTSHNGTVNYCDRRRSGRQLPAIVLAVTGRVRVDSGSVRRTLGAGTCS